MKLFFNAIASATIASTLWFGFTTSASAGRYVLDQSPTTLQQYFGRPLEITSTGTPNQKIYTYSAARLRRVMPTLAKQSTFSIGYVNDRATSIQLNIGLTKPGENFTFDQKAASQFYNYVFGYQPSIWKRVHLPNIGHEGFGDNKYCLGDGVATTFISSHLGDEWIQLFYDPMCEPPYDKLDLKQ